MAENVHVDKCAQKTSAADRGNLHACASACIEPKTILEPQGCACALYCLQGHSPAAYARSMTR
eukprot:1151204-Pelagomonas_calceolata.AAC.1